MQPATVQFQNFIQVWKMQVQKWSKTWCPKGHHDLWAAPTPQSKSCSCAGINLAPCYYNTLQRRRISESTGLWHTRRISTFEASKTTPPDKHCDTDILGALLISYPRLDSWLCTLGLLKHRNVSIWYYSILHIRNLFASLSPSSTLLIYWRWSTIM